MTTMNELIQNFPNQLREAVQIGEGIQLNIDRSKVRNIVVCGLGGSGIGASLVKELTANELEVPYSPYKGYSLPNYTNEHTLVIISSYSGNTEETVNMLHEAHKRGAQIVAITSGGKVLELSKSLNFDCIVIPGGMPPRACLGYSLVQQLYILKSLNFISKHVSKELNATIDLLEKNEAEIKQAAKDLVHLRDKRVIIYAADTREGVAVRWRQQLNENAKMLCWHHVIPEMNHNELVGWRDKDNNLAVILLRSESDYSRVQQRMEINKQVIQQYTNQIFEVYAKGDSIVQEAFYLINIGDWLSWYLSEARSVDAMEIDVINYLKGTLADMKW